MSKKKSKIYTIERTVRQTIEIVATSEEAALNYIGDDIYPIDEVIVDDKIIDERENI